MDPFQEEGESLRVVDGGRNAAPADQTGFRSGEGTILLLPVRGPLHPSPLRPLSFRLATGETAQLRQFLDRLVEGCQSAGGGRRCIRRRPEGSQKIAWPEGADERRRDDNLFKPATTEGKAGHLTSIADRLELCEKHAEEPGLPGRTKGPFPVTGARM